MTGSEEYLSVVVGRWRPDLKLLASDDLGIARSLKLLQFSTIGISKPEGHIQQSSLHKSSFSWRGVFLPLTCIPVRKGGGARERADVFA